MGNISYEELKKMSIKDYFKFFESFISKNSNIDGLTNLFTDKEFVDKKPYLYRRALSSRDDRFCKIEIVFDDENKLRAIVWDLEILLSDIVEIFGDFKLVNEPFSNTTAFIFESSNPQISEFKTRCSGWLVKSDSLESFVFYDQEKQNIEVHNPKVSFLQLNTT